MSYAVEVQSYLQRTVIVIAIIFTEFKVLHGCSKSSNAFINIV